MNHNIAVNCETKELANEFIALCQEKGIGLKSDLSLWDNYKNKTCYYSNSNMISYSSLKYATSESTCNVVRFEGVNNNSRTKDDLKTGTLVQTRNGLWWFVLRDMVNEVEKDMLVYLEKHWFENSLVRNFMRLSDFKSDMTYPLSENYDITKIAKCDYSLEFFTQETSDEFVRSLDGFEIVWDRDQAKKNQKIAELEDQIKKIENEHDALVMELQELKA